MLNSYTKLDKEEEEAFNWSGDALKLLNNFFATIFVVALRDNLSFCPVKLHTLAIVCEKSVQSQRLQASGVSGLKPVTICDAVIPETKQIDPCLTGLILVNHRGVYMDRRQLRFKSAIFHWGVGNGENMLSNGSPQDYKAINYRTTYHVNCDLIYHVQRPQSVAWRWGASIFESSSRLAKGNAFCAYLPLFSLSFANLFSAFRAAFRRSLSSPCFIVWRIPQNSTFGRSQVRQILRLLLQISFKYPAFKKHSFGTTKVRFFGFHPKETFKNKVPT